MRPTKTTHIFQVFNQQVKFSGNFDSGNLRTVVQTAHQEFLIQSSLDSYDHQVSKKSFFHFSVENYPIKKELTIYIPNIALLGCIKKKQNLNKYCPFYSTNGHDYKRLDQNQCQIIQPKNQQQFTGLRIAIFIQKQSLYYIAFALPYSYQRYLNFVRDLPYSTQYYLRKEVLCYSINLHLVFAITITSYDRQLNNPTQEEISCMEPKSTQILFPQRSLEKSQQKQKIFDKPVILLSGRVHPGQTPSSWAIQGIIKFLLSNQKQAILLRKHFQIVIVPMLNPDGVYEGFYRLDTKGHNLNRYYLTSDNRQPTIYCMKKLISHYSETKRLLYYFDFHGHPSFKGSFVYGNATQDIIYQTQTELFARILANKCQTFQEKYCIFDRQQMKTKHKLDVYTKQGCARVYAFSKGSVIHSYTVQMGFHSVSKGFIQQQITAQQQSTKQKQKSTQQKQKSLFFYTQQSYYKQGVDIMKCIAQSPLFTKAAKDIFALNQLRKTVASQIYNRQQRFKLEQKNLFNKIKNINEIIQNQYWNPIIKRFFSTFRRRTQKVQSSNSNSPNKKQQTNNSQSPTLNYQNRTDQKISSWLKNQPNFHLRKIQFQSNFQNEEEMLEKSNQNENVAQKQKHSKRYKSHKPIFHLKKFSSLNQSIQKIMYNQAIDLMQQSHNAQSPKYSKKIQKRLNSIHFAKLHSKQEKVQGRISLQKINYKNAQALISNANCELNNKKINFYKKSHVQIQKQQILNKNYRTQSIDSQNYHEKILTSKLTGLTLTPLEEGLLSPRAKKHYDDTEIFNDLKIRPSTIDIYSGKFCVVAESKLGTKQKVEEFKDVFMLKKSLNINNKFLNSNNQIKSTLNEQKYQSYQLQNNRLLPSRQKLQKMTVFSRKKHRKYDKVNKNINMLKIKGLQ